MKAVIMAGGEGTRLRPVSGKCPKPMVRLLGRPLLFYTLSQLKRHGITDVCLTLRCGRETIENEFGDGSKMGMSISYMTETTPLGTAGSVAACADFIGDEDFLVMSGDAVCDFDLKKLMQEHRQGEAAVTMALHSHADPLQYGLVLINRDGIILSFIEKPRWERVVTDLVNTGIYVVSPRAIAQVPNNSAFDFAKDLFPMLMDRGEKLRGIVMDGYWCDVGNPEAYRKCSMDALLGKIDMDFGVKTGEVIGSFIPRGVTVRPPCFISDLAAIEPGCIVGPMTVIGARSRICAGSHIQNSVADGAIVGENCTIDGAVLCEGAQIAPCSKITSGAVVAGPRAYAPPKKAKESAETEVKQKRPDAVVMPCRNRARVMRAMSEAMAEFGADFTDGITVSESGGSVHIAPSADESAISMELNISDEKKRQEAMLRYEKQLRDTIISEDS